MNWLNDNDPGAAAWLRELIRAGELPEGIVDERPIQEVRPEDVAVYRACHWFAGIGGWPYALRLAGWPDNRPVWTASCPCQPFSAAGKTGGTGDQRHLWPVLSTLIRECRPDCIFGEQVASKLGYEWLDGVRADLESQGYAFGAADLAAAGVGAPHIRQRLFWVANASDRRTGRPATPFAGSDRTHDGVSGENGPARRLADAGEHRLDDEQGVAGIQGGTRQRGHQSVNGCGTCRVADSDQRGRGAGSESAEQGQVPTERRGSTGRLADADGRQPGDGELQRGREHGQQPEDGGVAGGLGDAGPEGLPAPEREKPRGAAGEEGRPVGESGRSFWADSILIPCRDGKWRRVPGTTETGPESLLFPLAPGLPGRVGLLRGSGNSIVPQVAAQFVKAFLEAERELT